MVLTFSLLVVVGCASKDYYRDKGAEKARTYALENVPGLSPEARCHIRIARPRILEKNYMKDKPLSQVCYVWDPPTMNGKSILVVGVCNASYSDWAPIKAVVKNLTVEKEIE